MISVEASPERQKQLIDVVAYSAAKTINEGTDSIIFEITGTEREVNELIEKLSPFGIKKVARSGVLGIYRELEEV